MRVAVGGVRPQAAALSRKWMRCSPAERSAPPSAGGGAHPGRTCADPVDDVRGSAEYRRMLIPRLLSQAVARTGAPGMIERLALTLHVNGAEHSTRPRSRIRCYRAARPARPHGRQAWLQPGRVRRVHGEHRRRADARLPEPGAQLRHGRASRRWKVPKTIPSCARCRTASRGWGPCNAASARLAC